MAYKCLDCGHIFDDGEESRWQENHPYGMGYVAESFSGCPLCHGPYEESKSCKLCGGEFLEEELNGNGICDDCINACATDYDICYKISQKCDKETIKINPLINALLDELDIELILLEEIKKMKLSCIPFIEIDKEWFAEKLAEEVSK